MTIFKYFLPTLLFIISFSTFSVYAETRIGIIVPLEHEAMNQIVEGIKEALSNEIVDIKVKNAHGDINMMSTILKQMNDQDFDIIIPIATSTSQMAISHIKNKPIICTAANITPAVGSKVTGVNDEAVATSALSFLPSIKKIAVIYSASEKIAPEVYELKEYANHHMLDLHMVMAQSLVELPIAIRNIPSDVEAIFVLKDSLIVSGINILIQEAFVRNIPVITCDEGSIVKGATLAIGVREKDIGIKSGLIAKEIISGKDPGIIPYSNLKNLSLFINPEAFAKQNIITEKMINNIALPRIDLHTKDE